MGANTSFFARVGRMLDICAKKQQKELYEGVLSDPEASNGSPYGDGEEAMAREDFVDLIAYEEPRGGGVGSLSGWWHQSLLQGGNPWMGSSHGHGDPNFPEFRVLNVFVWFTT